MFILSISLISKSCVFPLINSTRLLVLNSFVFHLLILGLLIDMPFSNKHHYSGIIYLSSDKHRTSGIIRLSSDKHHYSGTIYPTLSSIASFKSALRTYFFSFEYWIDQCMVCMCVCVCMCACVCVLHTCMCSCVCVGGGGRDAVWSVVVYLLN